MPSGVALKKSAFCPDSVFMCFGMIIKINRNCFPRERQSVVLYTGHRLCVFFRGRKLMFKVNYDKCQTSEVKTCKACETASEKLTVIVCVNATNVF